MSYGLIQIGQDIKQQGMAGLQETERASELRDMQNKQLKQEAKNEKRSNQATMAGSGAMAGTMVLPGIGTAVGAALGYLAGTFM